MVRCSMVVRGLVLGAAVPVLFAVASFGAELPPEIQVDRLLVQAEREVKDGEHGSAVLTFERILKVSEDHGLAVPTAFWFRQAGVLHSAGLHERAVEASTRYLKEAGREGKHYREALDVLDAAEVGLAEGRRAEARTRAAAARAEREAAARAEAVAASVPEMALDTGRDIPHGLPELARVREGREAGAGGPASPRSCSRSTKRRSRSGTSAPSTGRAGGCRTKGWGRGDRPVINVSWDDAQAYVGWLSRETRAGLPPAERGGVGVRGARGDRDPVQLG